MLERLKTAFDVRHLTLLGVTTDGSHRYPDPLRDVFGDVPHQVCECHVVKEVVKAVLRAVASARKPLAAKQPTLPQGRPRTKAAKPAARKKKRLEQPGAEVFTHRHRLVQPHCKPSQRTQWWRITRGLPLLRKLREMMEQVSALFDRRCRMQTALDTLTKLRRCLDRFTHLGESLKKLFAPTVEKARVFLDDQWLPSTSHAVERGNRRSRKRQKSIYSVRTQEQIKARIALDMWREAQGEGRDQTLRA